MKLSIGTNYADFVAVVGAFPDLKKMFYGKNGSDVVNAVALFHSRDQYVEMNIGTGVVTETTFLAAFPSAINATVDALY